jgi:hypothetical protein
MPRLFHTGLAIAFALSLVIPGRAQSNTGSGGFGPQGGVRQGGNPLTNDDNFDTAMAERRLRALNAERQKQMVADTNKLLKLARELNDEVAAGDSDSFTADQLRKIAEIEKLAKSVKERMTSGAGEAPYMMQPPMVIYPVHQGP